MPEIKLAPRFDPPGSVLARLADKGKPLVFIRQGAQVGDGQPGGSI